MKSTVQVVWFRINSLTVSYPYTHIGTNSSGIAEAQVRLSQIALWVHANHKWDLYDLKNFAVSFIQTKLNMLGYVAGICYDVEINRVINRELAIDYLYGINIPCIADRFNGDWTLINQRFEALLGKAIGRDSIYLFRCFDDLGAAMRNPNDTAFHCYRAIESLRRHCATVSEIANSSKAEQWALFRKKSNCTQEAIMFLKSAADQDRCITRP